MLLSTLHALWSKKEAQLQNLLGASRHSTSHQPLQWLLLQNPACLPSSVSKFQQKLPKVPFLLSVALDKNDHETTWASFCILSAMDLVEILVLLTRSHKAKQQSPGHSHWGSPAALLGLATIQRFFFNVFRCTAMHFLPLFEWLLEF